MERGQADERAVVARRRGGTSIIAMSSPDPVAALRALVATLDPDVLAAAEQVDTTLIAAALARSPLERVEFAHQMLKTLSSFRHARAARL